MNAALDPKTLAAEGRPARIADAERQVRLDRAAFYRLMHRHGMSMLVYNHITARKPEPKHHFLINEYGLAYDEVTASTLVKVNLDGAVVDINPAGYIIHSCIHRARKDVACVVHTHSRAGVAVSCLKDGLMPINQEGMQFYGRIAYHDYEGIAVDEAEQERLVRDLGDKSAMILRNHGLIAVGRTIPEAFRRIYYLETACRLQIDLLATGQPLTMPSTQLAEHVARQWEDGAAGIGTGAVATREWPAMLRSLDRKDPSRRS